MKRTAIFTVGLALIGGILLAPAKATPNVACNLVAGDYIVTFKPGVDTGNELKNVNGRKVAPKYRYDKALNGFAGKLTTDEVCELKNNPRVEDIEADAVITTSEITTQSSAPSWGLDRIDQNPLPLNGTYLYETSNQGKGVTAYVIDTGINKNLSDFGARASTGYDAFTPTNPQSDCNGHGTHVAGTIGGSIYGVAKSVNLVAVRVLDCNGSGSLSGVLAGINWVINDHGSSPAVANMSLGGGASTSLDTAVKNLVSDGVTVAVAAGNDSRNASNFSPARVSQAITVAASDSNDALAYYSNYGAIVDIIAPGSNIVSDWYLGGSASMSGTSMATPHVAGVIALYLSSSNTLNRAYSTMPSNLLSAGKIRLSSQAKSAKTTTNLLFKSTL